MLKTLVLATALSGCTVIGATTGGYIGHKVSSSAPGGDEGASPITVFGAVTGGLIGLVIDKGLSDMGQMFQGYASCC